MLKLGGFTQGMDRAARETQQSMRRIESSILGVQKSFKFLTRGLSALGVGFGLGAIIRATAEAEKSFALLEQAVANNAGAAGKTAKELAEMATQLQHVSTFSDEAIQDAMGLLLTFRSIKGDNFDRAAQSVLDLATKMGKDLPSAALLLGKALQDPIKGMTQLFRAGVVLSPIQQKLVKDFVDVGNAAAAQAIILDATAAASRGFAAAARDNFGGALEGLKHDLETLLEADGGLPEATEAINSFAKVVQDPATAAGVDLITAALLKMGSVAVEALSGAARGVRDFGDYLLTFKILATQGIDIPIDLPAEEVEAELERLEARLEEKRKSYLVLIPTKLQKLETAEIERRIAILKGLKVEIPVEFTSGATGSRAGAAASAVELSKDQLADLGRLLDQAKDTKQKVDEQIELLNKGLKAGQFPGIEGLKEYARAYKYLQDQLDKPPKKTGLTEAQQAQKAIGDLITQMEQQIAVTGESEEATIRYRIAYGDLVDDFKKAGPAFEKRKQELIDAAIAMDQFKAGEELDKANEQIEQQVIELQAARIAQTEGAAAAYAYLAAHGELAKTLDLATDSQEEYNAALKRGQDAAAQLEFEQAVTSIQALVTSTKDATSAIIENAIAEEQGAVAAIRYAIAQGRLKDTFEDLGPAAAEWQKKLEDAAAAQEVLTQRQAEDAASEAIIPSRTKALEEYNNALAGLERRLAAGDISQRDFAQAVKIAEENFEDATKAIDEMSVFAEEAARNMQDAFADFLFDPFEGGLEGMLSGFADTLRRMSAELIASKLFEQFNAADLFKGGGIFGKLGDIFGGGGGGAPVGATPGINPYEPFPTIGTMGGGAAAGAAGTAATTAAATTTAATTFATAITTAGTAAATAFTAAGTTAATALTAAGTTVAASITAAGASAAAAIAAAGAGSAVAGGLSSIPLAGFDFSGIGFAKGGPITGPGTGTSDSVPIWASPGEVVIKATSALPNLDKLLYLNDHGRWPGEHFAAGGLVRPYAAPQGTPALPLYLAEGGLVERVAGPAGGREPNIIQQSITVNAPQGEVSRATQMQLTAAAARGARQADRHNN